MAQRVEQLRSMYDSPAACVADLLCDAHPADRVAFTIVEPDLSFRDLTYGELTDRSRRFAAALADLGIGHGDRVATLMGKSVDLVVVLLGIWRRGAVHVPLFTAFAASTVSARLAASGAKAVVCDTGQRVKIGPDGDLPVIVAVEPGQFDALHAGDLTVRQLLGSYQPDDPRAGAVTIGGDGVLVQLYTSGTTGAPKAVPLPVKALAAIHAYLEYGVDLRESDVYWNAADTGWGYGLFYGVLGPLALGMRNLLLRSAFSAELTWRVLERFKVTNFAAAPTVFRALRGCAPPQARRLGLRCLSSAGEPLTADVIDWARRTLGVPVRDHYGQSEHGMLIVNGWRPEIRRPVKSGSMGRPMPGWAATVLWPDRDEPAPPDTPGRIVIDVPASPLFWFPGYVDAAEQTAERFSPDGRWYYTGDTGRRDKEGNLYFSGRDDDVIIMAGYRIGPFEVESALTAHADIAEAAVVGVPDELRGEVIEAFVVPRPGVTPSEALAAELQRLVKLSYAAHAYPRSVHFVPDLPKNPSGKIQRSALRDRRAAANRGA